MKLVYNDKYPIVDSNMSDSNVGARKGKNIRNHIFIVNGVINEVIQDKTKAIDIQILDYKQCFDGMWLEDTVNDLYEAGITDDNLALIFKSNEKNRIAVKTPVGLTERVEIDRLVLQGEIFGPLECSVSVDKFGKECLEKMKHLYTYKNSVGVPPLTMIDDLFLMAGCGTDSVLLNAFINAKTNTKKLQFGASKCHKIHVGKKCSFCPDLYIDNWKLEEVDQAETGIIETQDEEVKMEEKESDKYLGDIIMNNGKNTKNIKARKEKAYGIIDQVTAILDNICFGPFQFEVAKILRDSLLINGILTNSEAWYNLTKEEINELQEVDEQLLRKMLETGKCNPKVMLYLEMGCTPIKFIIMKRRIMFLHEILNQEKTSLLFRFFLAMYKNPVRGDWWLTVKEDMEILNINLSLDEISRLKKYSLKNLLNKKSDAQVLNSLNSQKGNKVNQIEHKKLEMQKYLQPNTMSIEQQKFLFQLRSRMLDFKINFKGGQTNLTCDLCQNHIDDQESLLTCEKLIDHTSITKNLPKYEDIFSEQVNTQLNILSILQERYSIRKRLLKEAQKNK